MSTLATIVISHDCAIAQALRLQYQSRGRQVTTIAPNDREQLSDHQLCEAVIVDLSWSTEAEVKEGLAERLQSWQAFVQRCAGHHSKYLLLSEGRVFAGVDAEAVPVEELAETQPVDELGQTLVEAEAFLLAQSELQGLVLRCGPVISTAPGRRLAQCLELLGRDSEQALDNSRRSCPTPAIDLARVLSAMTDQLSCGAECRGLFNYNSSGACSHYEFVEVVHAYAAQFLPAESKIIEAEGGAPWQPWLPELQCQRLLGSFGIKQLPWRAWLPKLIKTLCEEDCK